MKQMEILVPGHEARAVVDLYTDHSPATVRAIEAVLPHRGTGIHAIRAGREVFVHLPDLPEDPGPENQSVFPSPGDIYLYHQDGGHRTLELPEDLARQKPPRWHVAIWYGRDSLPMTPRGLEAGNHFGEVVDGLDQLARACERIRFEGVTPMEFRIIDNEVDS